MVPADVHQQGKRVDQLLTISWWEWPEEILRQHMDKILSPDIQAFLEFAKTIPTKK